MSDLVQLNLSIDRELSEQVHELAEEYGWTKRQTITLAMRALKALMDGQGAFAAEREPDEAITLAVGALEALMGAHTAYAAQYDDDVGALYLRLAAEMPAGFVEVPKDGVRVGRAGDIPAVIVDGWLIFPGDDGRLLAEEQGGKGRIAIVDGGEIKPVKMPSAAEVALN